MNKLLIVLTALAAGILIFVSASALFFNGNAVQEQDNNSISANSSLLTLKVNIPCPGHSGLIIYELEKLGGVKDAKFKFPDIFDVYYDSSKTSKEKIIGLDIFKEYNAEAVNN